MRTREEIREERREYEADVAYEVWRSGGNMDNVNDERIEDNYYDGASIEHAAHIELEAQRPHRYEEQIEEAPQEIME